MCNIKKWTGPHLRWEMCTGILLEEGEKCDHYKSTYISFTETCSLFKDNYSLKKYTYILRWDVYFVCVFYFLLQLDWIFSETCISYMCTCLLMICGETRKEMVPVMIYVCTKRGADPSTRVYLYTLDIFIYVAWVFYIGGFMRDVMWSGDDDDKCMHDCTIVQR